MSRRGGLQAAAKHTGLSPWELRTGALSGKYPVMRVGGDRGRFWFDMDLLDEAIRQHMLNNSSVSEHSGEVRQIKGR